MESSNIELILVNISGTDRPGVTASLSSILSRYNAQILDIGQADIHHTLSLGILFKTTSDVSGDILKDLLFKASSSTSISASTLFQSTNMRNGSACRAKTDGLSLSSAVN